MICLSVNMRKFKIILAVSLGMILIAGILFSVKSNPDEPIMLADESSRVGFLNINGCDICEEPLECYSVTIPSEFNDIYEAYNSVQLAQGFDLSKYKGEKAEIYTYSFDDESDMLAVLILCGDRLIGCEKHSEEYGSEVLPIIEVPIQIDNS